MQSDVERLMAKIFVDSHLRERFLFNPKAVAQEYGLSADESSAMEIISAPSLRVSAQSYERKRTLKSQHNKIRGMKARLHSIADVILSIAARMG